jgi:hypothetical protein
LVLRFEDRGREVVVEGEVAWRHTGESGGQFGIKFTALDSRSVGVLRELCGTQIQKSAPQATRAAPAPAKAPRSEPTQTEQSGRALTRPQMERGAPVKLHIEGLGAPMKARVRDGAGRSLHVGSNLEFLKLGRGIEIEDLADGDRSEAEIHSVTVAIDPKTQVPELVVSLRYAGDITPEPSVVDQRPERELAGARRPPALAASETDFEPSAEPPRAAGRARSDEHESDEVHGAHAEEAHGGDTYADEDGAYADDYEDLDGDMQEAEDDGDIRQRLSDFSSQAAAVMKEAGGRLGQLSGVARMTLGRLASGAAREIKTRGERKKPLRKTAPAPKAAGSALREGRLRPQAGTNRRAAHAPASASAKAGPVLSKRAVKFGGLAIIACAAGFYFSRGGEEPLPVASQIDEVPPSAMAQNAGQAPEMAAAEAPVAEGAPAPTTANGITADIPLFGAKPLATAAPEPLGAAEAEVETYDDVPDESFEAKTVPAVPAGSDQGPDTYSRGRLHLPTVHRLRLDGAAATLKGTQKPTGFSVLIPGRKVMESGKGISKRDDRIVKVDAENTPEGAVVTFRFRKQIPAYKVRLRKDFVEFFVSAPEAN